MKNWVQLFHCWILILNSLWCFLFGHDNCQSRLHTLESLLFLSIPPFTSFEDCTETLASARMFGSTTFSALWCFINLCHLHCLPEDASFKLQNPWMTNNFHISKTILSACDIPKFNIYQPTPDGRLPDYTLQDEYSKNIFNSLCTRVNFLLQWLVRAWASYLLETPCNDIILFAVT